MQWRLLWRPLWRLLPPTHTKWTAATICSFTLVGFSSPSLFPHSTTCVICCFRADAKDLDDIIGAGTSMPRSDDLEQCDSDEPSEYYPPSSYGTYVPPTMLTVDTDDAPVTLNPSGGGATGGGVLPRRAPADID